MRLLLRDEWWFNDEWTSTLVYAILPPTPDSGRGPAMITLYLLTGFVRTNGFREWQETR